MDCTKSSQVFAYTVLHVYMLTITNEKRRTSLLQILGKISGMDQGVYGVSHCKGQVAVVAGTTLYTMTINPKIHTAVKEP